MEIIVILAGGDFTGRVFCSTLEGEFVKAFGYTNGQLNGTLVVMKRSELEKHRDKGWGQNYSSVNLMEGVRTRAGTYVFDEGGSSSGLCPHGYPENSCSICLDEVIVTGCRYCHMQNGCICDCCFYCGNKEPECTCMRCTRCRNKMQDCICYIYPDPDPNPDPNPHPGGGGGTIVNPPDPTPDSGETTISNDVDLTDQDNFVGYDVSGDCMAGCRSIMANYGVETGSSANVYQLLFERDGVLEYYDTENYATVYDNAISCIDRHLDADRPIIVGVNHTPNRNINEGATDHWIVIAGRGYDATQQQYYYTYMDSGRYSGSAAAACSTTDNRLYYDPDNYTFRDDANYRNLQLDVTQIRPNDGQNLNETITQPARPN